MTGIGSPVTIDSSTLEWPSVVGNASRLRRFHGPTVDRAVSAGAEDRPLVGTRS